MLAAAPEGLSDRCWWWRPGRLEHRGRPTAGLAGSEWLPPLHVPEREQVKAIAAARARRLAEHLEVRVRCGGGCAGIQLAGGRLRLLTTRVVQRLMGHESLDTTMLYAEVTDLLRKGIARLRRWVLPPEWVPGYVQVLQHLPGETPSTWTRPGRLRAGTELLIDTPTERLFLTARGMLVLACKREDGTVEKTQVSIV